MIQKDLEDQIITFGFYAGKKLRETPIEFQKDLESKNIKRDFLLYFDILKTPIDVLIKDEIVFTYLTTYESNLSVGTLRGFFIGEPILDIKAKTLFNRKGWYRLEKEKMKFKVKNGFINKIKKIK